MELAHTAPLSQNELAARLRLEKSTVSRLVSLLEERGWLIRSRSPHDRRALELRLSEAGARIAAELAQARRDKFARVFAAIPEADRPAVLESLRILVEAMREGQ
jgi:DNA-binding MarR family transcriptional regulator